MRVRRIASSSLLVAGPLLLSACGGAQPEARGVPSGAALAASSAVAAPTFYADALPVFRRNCVECHRGDKPKGDLSRREVI